MPLPRMTWDEFTSISPANRIARHFDHCLGAKSIFRAALMRSRLKLVDSKG
jgi:hypothetical protein